MTSANLCLPHRTRKLLLPSVLFICTVTSVAADMPKAEFLARMRSGSFAALCQPSNLVRGCFNVPQNMCETIMYLFNRLCISESEPSIPDKIEVPKQRNEIAVKIGRCVVQKYFSETIKRYDPVPWCLETAKSFASENRDANVVSIPWDGKSPVAIAQQSPQTQVADAAASSPKPPVDLRAIARCLESPAAVGIGTSFTLTTVDNAVEVVDAGGGLILRGGKIVYMIPGALHKIRGEVRICGLNFVSDPAAPLIFLTDSRLGYVYQSGIGIVTSTNNEQSEFGKN